MLTKLKDAFLNSALVFTLLCNGCVIAIVYSLFPPMVGHVYLVWVMSLILLACISPGTGKVWIGTHLTREEYWNVMGGKVVGMMGVVNLLPPQVDMNLLATREYYPFYVKVKVRKTAVLTGKYPGTKTSRNRAWAILQAKELRDILNEGEFFFDRTKIKQTPGERFSKLCLTLNATMLTKSISTCLKGNT